jgi:23S rRNA pseudouridine1911/1915/1917 synthase
MRLDLFLAEQLPELTRSQLKRLIEQEQVLVDNQPAKVGEKLKGGETIRVTFPALRATEVVAQELPLQILYEDAHLIVINKPAGLVVHPAPGHSDGTLVNALLHHCQDLAGIGGELRPGIVHRLDKDTSGLLIVARNDDVHRRLSAMLKRRTIRRAYTAVAWGHLATDDLTVDAPLGRSPSDRRRVIVLENGKNAVTHFHRKERWRAADLLEARLETGRTHQIRVHLLSIGHPVAGDRDYPGGAVRGVSGPDRGWAREFAAMLSRQFLHASNLTFTHPVSRQVLDLESPLPPELEAAATWARRTSGGTG